MRRDMELVRDILERIEGLNGSSNIYPMYPEYFDTYKVVKGTEEKGDLMFRHFALLVDSGFVDGESKTGNVHGLTWAGHNLIDQLR
jgi:hypothetical protein